MADRKVCNHFDGGGQHENTVQGAQTWKYGVTVDVVGRNSTVIFTQDHGLTWATEKSSSAKWLGLDHPFKV